MFISRKKIKEMDAATEQAVQLALEIKRKLTVIVAHLGLVLRDNGEVVKVRRGKKT